VVNPPTIALEKRAERGSGRFNAARSRDDLGDFYWKPPGKAWDQTGPGNLGVID